MENKQTAVEWFEEALAKNLKEIIYKCDNELMESLFKQAKQMEREQIEEAYTEGFINCPPPDYIGKVITSSDYFTKTYQNGK